MTSARWGNPRNTIASKFEKNDFGYVTAGALGAANMIVMLNMLPSITKTMTFLDYGCGTGRMSRILTPFFRGVIGYDPTPECIEESIKESDACGTNFGNLKMTHNLDNVPVCDVGCCINVLEHLTESDTIALINNLKAKVIGNIILTYPITKNYHLILPYLTDKQIQEDKGNTMQVRLVNFNAPIS